MKRTILCGVCILGFLCACHERQPGPFEKAGSRVDEIRDNAEEGKPLLHKKDTLEKAGEAVDDALGTNTH